jgi:hypothetical protein
VSRLERGADTDELYDDYYYDRVVNPLMLPAADAIARSIRREFEWDGGADARARAAGDPLSWALPGSHGTDHVNEQPNEYWIAKFRERGFGYEQGLAMRLRAEWRKVGVVEIFFRSLMVFRASHDG